MMNAHVMMLVLASGLFSAMWSSDHPSGQVGPLIANRPEQPHQQPTVSDSLPLEKDGEDIGEPIGTDPAIALPTTGSTLPPVRALRPVTALKPVRAVPPRLRVAVNANGLTEISMQNEIANIAASARQVISTASRRVVQQWLVTTRKSLQQAWNRLSVVSRSVTTNNRPTHDGGSGTGN